MRLKKESTGNSRPLTPVSNSDASTHALRLDEALVHIHLALCPVWALDNAPLGLASIASYLRGLGHTTSVYDFNFEMFGAARALYAWLAKAGAGFDTRAALVECALSNGAGRETQCWETISATQEADFTEWIEGVAKRLLKDSPDVIGFSTFWPNLPCTLAVCRALRECGRDVRIVFGGPECMNSLALMRQLLGNGFADAVVLGEGEVPLRKLLGTEDGIGQLCQNDYVPRVFSFEDFENIPMDELPVPNFSGLPLHRYTYKRIPLCTSRGCVGRCTFCRERMAWRPFQQRSVSSVIADLRQLVDTTGCRAFRFTDSLINGSHDWLVTFCERVADEELGVAWFANARVDRRMNEHFFKLAHKSGCQELMFGIESANQAVLRTLRKEITVEDASRVLGDCSRAGIQVHTYWMLGCPGEGLEEASQTLRFIAERVHDIDGAFIHRYDPIDWNESAVGDSRLWINLPLFSSVAVSIQQRVTGYPVETDTLNPALSAYRRKARLNHSTRKEAIVLLAVLERLMRRVEEAEWFIAHPHETFIAWCNLNQKKVLLLVPALSDHEFSFLRKLCQIRPQLVRVCLSAPATTETVKGLADLFDANNVSWELWRTPSQVGHQDEDTELPRCRDVCVALLFASPAELTNACRQTLASLQPDSVSPQQIWKLADSLTDRFMSVFCAQRCSSSDSCISEGRGMRPKAVSDGWY